MKTRRGRKNGGHEFGAVRRWGPEKIASDGTRQSESKEYFRMGRSGDWSPIESPAVHHDVGRLRGKEDSRFRESSTHGSHMRE
jgi:hypothetical protein